MNHLTTQLKRFRVIEPTPAFRHKTLSLILDNKPRKTWSFRFNWILAPALASLVLVVVIGGRILGAKPALSSFSSEGLQNEFDNLSINIDLKEISYHQSVNQEIATAITEITNNKTSHLSPSLLQQESDAQNINFDSPNSNEINNLLDQVIF